jgi:mannose-6-phosphate isomerase-like protein (cupin superfamily)
MVANSTSGCADGAMSVRKEEVRRLSDVSAPERRHWLQRAAFFHDEDLRYLRFLIPPGARVLELGCGTGELLAALEPSFGVGVDFSPGMIAQARKAHPDVSFFVGDVENAGFIRSLPGPFDAIVVVDTLGALDDCQAFGEPARPVHARDSAGSRLLLAFVVSGAEIRRGGRRQAPRQAPRRAHRPYRRPWGYYQDVDNAPRYRVKRIIVKPGSKLSLQKHFHRSEHWVAEVTLGSDVRSVHENESIYIPIGSVHRLANPGKIPLDLQRRRT